MKESKNYLFAVISGLLLAMAFPPMYFKLFAFFGFIPILFVLEQKPKRPLLLVYITFFVYHYGTNWWISSWQKDCDPWLFASGVAIAFFHPLIFMFPFIIYKFIRTRLEFDKAIYFFPFIWVTYEWLHSLGEVAYPWITIAYTQAEDRLWMQFADITGMWGLSFVIVFINILILKLIVEIRKNSSDLINFKTAFTSCRYNKYVIPILALFLIPYIYGFIRINDFSHEDLMKNNQKIRVALIQPAINPWKKWEVSTTEQIYRHMHIQDSILDKVPNVELALWSETAITYLNLELNAYHNLSPLQQWVNTSKTSVLSGFADIVFYKKGESPSVSAKMMPGESNSWFDSYNSAIIINPRPKDNDSVQIYHKMKLTPFGERIPYLQYIAFTKKWLEWGVGISSWDLGKEQKCLVLKNEKHQVPIGQIICIESLYPAFVADYVRQGAQMLAVITNDAWYDHTPGPEQHYLISCMRAVETRRYVARCANTGVSGFIEPDGNTIKRAPEYTGAAIYTDIPLLSGKSLYVILGDWLPYLCDIVVVLGIVLAIAAGKKKKTS